MDTTTGVVLAAGEGTRLRPLTRNRPKPMLPAAGRPVLEYVLDALIEAGIEELVLVVGYGRDRVQDHFGPTYRDRPVEYVVQGPRLGSGHALLQARDVVDGPIVVVNGDRVVDASMIGAVRSAHGDDVAATVGVIEGPDPSRYGAVSLDGDRVTGLVEKPADDAPDDRPINAGIYAFGPSVFDALEATPRRTGELPLPDTVAGLVGTDRSVRGVVVGPDCELAPGAVVGPDTALGQNVTVGANAVVEGSVIDADTRVGPASALSDCVTGRTVRLGPNTVAPGGPADVVVDERVFRDERLGAVVADRARAGGGVRLAPGTLIGPSARLGTGVVAEGRIEEGAEVVR